MSHRFTSENDGDQSSDKVAALSLVGERANQLQHIHNCFTLAQEHGHGFPRVYRRAQQSYALQVSGYKICRMDFFFPIVKTWPWPGQSFCARWRFATCYHGYVCHQERKKKNNNNTIISAIAIHYFGISWIAFRAVCSFFGQFKVTSQRLPMKPLQTSLRMSTLP